MKHTGHYCSVESPYDVDHEINRANKELSKLILGIDSNGQKRHEQAIIKSMIQTLLDEL